MSKIIINGKSDGSLKAYKGGDEIASMYAGGAVAYRKMDTGTQPEPPTPSRNYLRLSSVGTILKLRVNVSGGVYDPGLEYSTDKQVWTAIPITSTDTITINIPSGTTSVYLRSTQPLAKKDGGTTYTIKPYLSHSYSISGHIASVIDYRVMDSITSIPDHALAYVFSGISTLASAGDLSFDGITSVGVGACSNMFSYNQNLTSAPDTLPATTLSDACYDNMFYNCPALTSAPKLPATTLADYCYYQMFRNCTSLPTAPALPATAATTYCYYEMFYGCTSLTMAPALPATTMADHCYQFMFQNCTHLTIAPATLPATTLSPYCYNGMFQGCSSLERAPKLPAQTLVSNCYSYMFYNCSRLNTIWTNASSWVENCSYKWVYGVATSGTFYKRTFTSIPRNSNGIPGTTATWPTKMYT